MVNRLSSCCSKNTKPLPIENLFKLPSPIPTWQPGEGFGRGTIDLGGLQVCQVSTFIKVWASRTGGPNNSGATFFEPSQIGKGFRMLGCYAQPNNKPLFGWVLVGKDITNQPSSGALKMPIRYECIWSSESLKTKENSNAYIWLPIAPPNYKAIGYVVTNSPESPPLNKIWCVRSDFTENCEKHSWIWGLKKKNNRKDPKEFGIYSLRPTNRGKKALGVSTGTFLVQKSGDATLPLACLKNANHLSYMPDLDQIEKLIKTYSPIIYFHPNDKHLPSSVSWFFENGVRLYREGEKSNLVQVEPTGSNLPQDGSDGDGGGGGGASWLALPVDGAAKKLVKMGNLQEAKVYLHIKPMLGGTFTDIVMWLFYPYNGPAKARVCGLIKIPLCIFGQHVGDWEHVTLRISNFSGELKSVYLSQHNNGKWADASELEFQKGNKPVVYASRNGHAFYPTQGDDLQGCCLVGLVNETSKSGMVLDAGECSRFLTIAAHEALTPNVVEPPWLKYIGKWGPKTNYVLGDKIKVVLLKLKIILPKEVLGEEGPDGPKQKKIWSGDEIEAQDKKK